MCIRDSHDTMRAVRRTACRAKLPLRYSQGFNPRPLLSLACPRPVGVATRDDLLVLVLDAPMEGADILAAMNDRAPEGMRFIAASRLTTKKAPRPRLCRYEMPIPDDLRADLRPRLDELMQQANWPIERLVTSRRGRQRSTRQIDLRPLVAELRLTGDVLQMKLVPHADLWARCGEVLRLLGLDERLHLAMVVRTAVECDN